MIKWFYKTLFIWLFKRIKNIGINPYDIIPFDDAQSQYESDLWLLHNNLINLHNYKTEMLKTASELLSLVEKPLIVKLANDPSSWDKTSVMPIWVHKINEIASMDKKAKELEESYNNLKNKIINTI